MARLRGHRPLDYEQPLVVLRSLVFGGRAFVVGDVLPWRQLGLSARKVYQLWDQRRIGHERPADRNGAENVTALVQRHVERSERKRRDRR